jgi:transposase
MKDKTEFSISLKLSHIKIKRVEIDKVNDFHIYVSCQSDSTLCHKCNQVISKSHGQCSETIIQHLPILDNRVFIHVSWPRFICDKCDGQPTTSFHPEWLSESGDCTKDYENYILKCLINSTVKDVAEKNKTTEERIEGIINRRILLDVNWEEMKITRMGVDEIALKKGHNHYLSIISDISIPGRTRIIKVLDGRSQEEILPFFKSIPKNIWQQLESVSTDMGVSYLSTLRKVLDEYLFDKIVTIDRFHVAKIINGKVDKERKKVCHAYKKEHKDDEVALDKIKDTMWPFRHHPESLDEDELKRLEILFKASPDLKVCHEIREELYQIFESDLTKEIAKTEIDAWCLLALGFSEKNNPFESFVKTYYQHESIILNYFVKRHSSGPVEGLNNKIKVIKRRGFGFDNVLNFAKRLFLDINLKEQFIPKLA